MKRELIEVGKRYTYHPDENEPALHFPCVIDSFTTHRVRIKIEGEEKMKSVSPRAISDQVEMFGD